MRERWLTVVIAACTTVDPAFEGIVHDDPIWHAECAFTRTCNTNGESVLELSWQGSYDAPYGEIDAIAWDWVHACAKAGLGTCDFTNCAFGCMYTPP